MRLQVGPVDTRIILSVLIIIHNASVSRVCGSDLVKNQTHRSRAAQTIVAGYARRY